MATGDSSHSDQTKTINGPTLPIFSTHALHTHTERPRQRALCDGGSDGLANIEDGGKRRVELKRPEAGRERSVEAWREISPGAAADTSHCKSPADSRSHRGALCVYIAVPDMTPSRRRRLTPSKTKDIRRTQERLPLGSTGATRLNSTTLSSARRRQRDADADPKRWK